MTPVAPTIALPRQRGAVTVRAGSLADDLDHLHEGDPLWWGKQFVAERMASMPPGTPHLMLIGELDRVPVADAFVLGVGIKAGGYAMADLFVRAEARGRGVGSSLLAVMAEFTEAVGLPGLTMSVAEPDGGSVAVAEHWGARLAGHHRESVLDLDSMDVAAAEALVARAEDASIRLAALPEDASDEALAEAYDMFCRVWGDAPDAEGSDEVMPYSVFRGFFPDPSYVLMAWRDDEPVGITVLMDRAKDQAVNTLFTGVARDARGLGLSVALKAAHALHLRARGQHRIFTQNMDQNAPILAANHRLGFRVESGYFDLALPVPWPPPA
jgi:GNAT superfamily N-acetyltransferase